jgi:hypothetical protein
VAASALAALFTLSVSHCAFAQNRVTIDASSAVPPVQPVAAQLGTNRNPQGHVLSVNSQYLILDGKPWLPVMGEIHYSRVPESEWESSILKMKASGVQIIASYVIWIHHEQTEGKFDWSGQKNLRHFAELCAKHGVYFYPRIGPWAHGEVRNGGMPDWVLAKGEVRKNNPIYLEEVRQYYAEIGKQLRGLYWKDGGPVIGIQLENEYKGEDPTKGAEHIRTLKQMAIAEGMDVPLYTVTGWDRAVIPLDAVLPVFGGYPDAPWDASPKKMPPADVYAFRFANRASGSMGAIGGSGQSSSSVYQGTPFLTAEVGGGIQDTYFRRPVVTPDDIAAMIPVMVGSGANLLGYYMYHGGRNPEGGDITLQESQRTGYPTDVPVKLYDFQAPISADGNQRESLNRLKLIHYFLNDFGAQLATMVPHSPERTPATPEDLSMVRVAARTSGESGYLFLNNYVRGAEMPNRPGFSVSLKLPQGTMQVPEEPINLPSGAYGIWPVNLSLDGTVLRYSTAQLITRLSSGNDSYYFFFTIPGIQPEFLLAKGARIDSTSKGVTELQGKEGIKVRIENSNFGRLSLGTGSRKTHLIILSRDRAEDLWKTDEPKAIFRFAGQFYADGEVLHLQQDGETKFTIGLFLGGAKNASSNDELFQEATFSVPGTAIHTDIVQERKSGTRLPWVPGIEASWRSSRTVIAPEASEFDTVAAKWKISIRPQEVNAGLHDILLRVRYQGDVAQLSQGGNLLNDDFWNGQTWETGLKEVSASPISSGSSFDLSILPLPSSYPMYLEKTNLLEKDGNGSYLSLDSVEAIPQYQVDVKFDQSTGRMGLKAQP